MAESPILDQVPKEKLLESIDWLISWPIPNRFSLHPVYQRLLSKIFLLKSLWILAWLRWSASELIEASAGGQRRQLGHGYQILHILIQSTWSWEFYKILYLTTRRTLSLIPRPDGKGGWSLIWINLRYYKGLITLIIPHVIMMPNIIKLL